MLSNFQAYLGIKIVAHGWSPDYSGLPFSLSFGPAHVMSRYPVEFQSVFRIYLKMGDARCGLSIFYNRTPVPAK